MILPNFLTALFEHGNVRVGAFAAEISPAEWRAAREVLEQAEGARRLDFPGEPPPWNAAAGAWAAGMLYRACQLAVERNIDAATAQAAMAAPCPEGPPAGLHYSVDLVFQFMPDLYRLAQGASHEDPLLQSILGWAAAWPLSSVGIEKLPPPSLAAIEDHPGLLVYYVDRIVARHDWGRLAYPAVREAARAAVGIHASLSPELAKALATPAVMEAR